MAPEIIEITDSNHDELKCYLDHLLTDLHLALKQLDRIGVLTEKHDALLEEFRPLLDQYRSPAAAYITRRTLRRNGARQDPP